ncbi:MAG: GAF domain-containing protein [Fimbriimonadaceae bacterium]|nr:GAF domain-containing protein [Fimbriimonadaceae bacterium]
MISTEVANRILAELNQNDLVGHQLRRRAMELLSALPNYNWSGIYRLEGNTLVLDEYVGAETDHTRIEVGVGVCGTAVAEDANQIIEDVRNLDNYLACSLQTRSEIVVLIRRDGEILGQIDIDGHRVGAFDVSDEDFLDRMASVLAERWD